MAYGVTASSAQVEHSLRNFFKVLFNLFIVRLHRIDIILDAEDDKLPIADKLYGLRIKIMTITTLYFNMLDD